MPKTMGNTITFNDNAGNLLQNGIVTTNEIDVSGNIQAQQVDVSGNITAIGTLTASQATINGDVNLTGSIVNGSNALYFNEQYKFIDIPENTHVYGTFFLDYGGNTFNVGQIIAAGTSGTYAPYPSITYDASTNTTTFTGAMVSQPSAHSSSS